MSSAFDLDHYSAQSANRQRISDAFKHGGFSSDRSEMPKFSYLKRTFLEPASSHTSSYILAEIESSEDGANKHGTNRLIVADCGRRIELRFFLHTPQERRRSLKKAKLLAEVVNRFCETLREEAELIKRPNHSSNVVMLPKSSSLSDRLSARRSCSGANGASAAVAVRTRRS